MRIRGSSNIRITRRTVGTVPVVPSSEIIFDGIIDWDSTAMERTPSLVRKHSTGTQPITLSKTEYSQLRECLERFVELNPSYASNEKHSGTAVREMEFDLRTSSTPIAARITFLDAGVARLELSGGKHYDAEAGKNLEYWSFTQLSDGKRGTPGLKFELDEPDKGALLRNYAGHILAYLRLHRGNVLLPKKS